SLHLSHRTKLTFVRSLPTILSRAHFLPFRQARVEIRFLLVSIVLLHMLPSHALSLLRNYSNCMPLRSTGRRASSLLLLHVSSSSPSFPRFHRSTSLQVFSALVYHFSTIDGERNYGTLTKKYDILTLFPSWNRGSKNPSSKN